MSLNSIHLDYLQSVNNLSRRNIGLTGKNPSVACLIVDYSKSSKGILISYGLTSFGGSPHAEVNALNKIGKNKVTKKTVMYLSLEPCLKKSDCCAKIILKKGIKKVYISSLDPNPLIFSKGIKYLISNNVKVFHSIKKRNSFKYINKYFYNYQIKKRPYITLKLAISKNGFTKNFYEKNITSLQTQYYMHKFRLTHDAIAVGYKTFFEDKPKLTCRLNGIDKKILKFVISNEPKKLYKFNCIQIQSKDEPKHFFEKLNSYKIKSIMIEGGLSTFNYFYKNQLFDEIIICQSSKYISSSKKRYKLNQNIFKNNLKLYSSKYYGEDIIKTYRK